MIKEPRWSRPACLEGTRTFDVVLQSETHKAPAAVLRDSHGEIPAFVEQQDGLVPVWVRCQCSAPRAAPGHLYDLEVSVDGQQWCMPRAVVVPAEAPDGLTILHCSDLHLLKLTPEGVLADRSAGIEALVSCANFLRPDLVVCTGDLIQRYDADKHALPQGCIRWQIQQIYRLLSVLKVPLYVTVGNHDVAFEPVRPYWYQVVGGGWKEGPDDASLDWAGHHLVLMDCFGHYDAQNCLVVNSFTEAQLHWLRQDLLAAAVSRTRLVFAHYDYHQQLPPLMKDLRIDALFYGHAQPLCPEVFCESGTRGGHLDASQAFQLVELTAQGIRTQLTSWDELDCP